MFTQFRKGGMMVNDMMESMPITPAAGQQVSFFERMKQYLNPAQLKQAIITSKDTIIEMGIYLGIGFLVGFALKKYSKYVLVALLCIAGLIVLQQFEFVSIGFNTVKIQDMFGIKSAQMDTDMMTMYWQWIKLNASIVISFSIGFLFGLKVG